MTGDGEGREGWGGLLRWNEKGKKVDGRSGEKEGGMEGAEGQEGPRGREEDEGWSGARKKIIERPGKEEERKL